jgi:hypothetical protein
MKAHIMPELTHDIPISEDAIPKDAISLTDAFGYIVSFIGDHPELLPTFDQQWSEALEKSREEERRIQHGAETFDQELEQEWHRRKEANLFLRLAIEERELVACTRDPHTGTILQLDPDGWIPTEWDSYIPPGIWTNFIIPDDYESPGPSGTLIRGELRPVFFLGAEFGAWFNEMFGQTEPIVVVSDPNPNFQRITRFVPPRQQAVIDAVEQIWSQNGPPPGEYGETRRTRINSWFKDNDRKIEVSLSTIQRALKARWPDRF